jgi:hypothetical protein
MLRRQVDWVCLASFGFVLLMETAFSIAPGQKIGFVSHLFLAISESGAERMLKVEDWMLSGEDGGRRHWRVPVPTRREDQWHPANSEGGELCDIVFMV